MSGKQIKDIESFCPAKNILKTSVITYFLDAEGAKTFPQVYRRAQELLQWIKINAKEDKILLVCHGDIGKMIYVAFYRLDWKKVLLQFHFGNSEVILLEEGSRYEDRHIHKVEQHNH